MNKKYLFLLGGYDLEMIEIKNILEKYNKEYLDKELNWGAKLSDYSEEIEKNRDKTIVGIELKKDLNINCDYIEIDHHNNNIDKKSSIEQIAELLEINLSRDQKLIAANDSGYIPAMKKLKATEEEINKIRRMDRKIQGATKEDEKLAEKSIKENKREYDDLIVIKSLTPKFSTITDRLYPTKKLFIYTENEFTYYGEKARELGEKYQNKYGDKIYFGGTENGYFGAGQDKFSLDKIEEIKDEVIRYVGGKK